MICWWELTRMTERCASRKLARQEERPVSMPKRSCRPKFLQCYREAYTRSLILACRLFSGGKWPSLSVVPSVVTRAPAAGAYPCSEAKGCFDGCCVRVHGLVARVPPCGSPRKGWSMGPQERWITTQRTHPPYRIPRSSMERVKVEREVRLLACSRGSSSGEGPAWDPLGQAPALSTRSHPAAVRCRAHTSAMLC